MDETLLHLDQPLLPAEAPPYAEHLEVAARLIQTVMVAEQFERLSIRDVQDVPEKSAYTTGISLTYHRRGLTAVVDLWDDDCQYAASHRCFAFRSTFWLGAIRETMPFNRHKWGHPLRQQWRQRTDLFLEDLREVLALLSMADQQGRFQGVVTEVQPGYGFIRSPGFVRLYFNRSQLRFSQDQLLPGLCVSFTLGDNAQGRQAVAVEISTPAEEGERPASVSRDHSTARPEPLSVRLLDRPLGADDEGRSIGRLKKWPSGKNFGFIEGLLDPRIFLHASALTGRTRGNPDMIGRGVRFRLAKASDGRLQAAQAEFLPEDIDLSALLSQELTRAEQERRGDDQQARRFRISAGSSPVNSGEKRPIITVAALRDVTADTELLFVHTRWADLGGLRHQEWRSLLDLAARTYPFRAPALVYCSTTEGLYQLSQMEQPVPAAVELNDPALKRQLELAAPHLDD